jgi:putative DNA primase/helicase
VHAALTVLRAYHHANHQKPEGVVDLGSFEGWSRLVRDALVWLGEADPVATMEEARKSDPKRITLDMVMQAWERLGPAGAGRVRVKHLVDLAATNSEWADVLSTIARSRNGTISANRLGRWLAANKGRMVNGRRIDHPGIVDGYPEYTLFVSEWG